MNRKNILMTSIYLIILISMGVIFWIFFKILKIAFLPSLAKSFIYPTNKLLFWAYLLLIVFPIMIFVLAKLANLIESKLFESKNKFNPWAFAMIIYMIFIPVFGLISFNEIVGQERLSLILWNQDNEHFADLNCGELNNNIYVGQWINCSISKEFIVNSAKVITRDPSGDSYQDFSNLRFFTYNPSSHFRFLLNGVDVNNRTLNLTTGTFFEVYKIEDDSERMKDLLNFLYILLGVVFIAVPTSIYYIRKVMLNKD